MLFQEPLLPVGNGEPIRGRPAIRVCPGSGRDDRSAKVQNSGIFQLRNRSRVKTQPSVTRTAQSQFEQVSTVQLHKMGIS